MKVGARVLVFAEWSSFRGMRGTVTQSAPFMMVLLDGERQPLRVGKSEVLEESEPLTLTGPE
jgi:hypothetical protein